MHSRLYIWVARRDHFCVKSVCVFKLDLISSDDVHTSESVWRASHTTYVSGCAHTDERLSHSDDTISWDVGDRGRAGCIPSRRAARGRGSHFRPKSLTTPNQKQPGRKVNERFMNALVHHSLYLRMGFTRTARGASRSNPRTAPIYPSEAYG